VLARLLASGASRADYVHGDELLHQMKSIIVRADNSVFMSTYAVVRKS